MKMSGSQLRTYWDLMELFQVCDCNRMNSGEKKIQNFQ